MNRRDALMGSAAVAAAFGAIACAPKQANAEHPHHHIDPSQASLADAALECVRKGNLCAAHCIALLGQGDTSMANCAATVSAMLPAMQALAAIASTGNKRTTEIAKALVKLCEDCEAACRTHADKHETCKGCMISCQQMIAAAAKLT